LYECSLAVLALGGSLRRENTRVKKKKKKDEEGKDAR
jgi:hypothetical protein